MMQRSAADGLACGVYVFAIQRWAVGGVQDIERLYYSAVQIGNNSELLVEEQAERLVSAAVLNADDWLSAGDTVDFSEAAGLANDTCLAAADSAYKAFIHEHRSQNEDRADIQERAAEAHFSSRHEKLTNVRDRHIQAGRHGLARATEGQIEALKRWVARERERIAERRRLTEHKEDICVGMILLE